MDMSIQKTCRAIEAKLKEKNTFETAPKAN
jgi:hypothetical protein